MTERTIAFPIPRPICEHITDLVMSTDFPWYFVPDATHLTPNGNASFAHVLINNYDSVSPFTAVFTSALAIIAEHAGYYSNEIYRARLGLLYPSKQEHNSWHTDYDSPHTTCLWYINNSDGDTRFRFGDNISPQRNGVLTFNGLEQHASSPPSTGVRIVLNVNLMTSE